MDICLDEVIHRFFMKKSRRNSVESPDQQVITQILEYLPCKCPHVCEAPLAQIDDNPLIPANKVLEETAEFIKSQKLLFQS